VLFAVDLSHDRRQLAFSSKSAQASLCPLVLAYVWTCLAAELRSIPLRRSLPVATVVKPMLGQMGLSLVVFVILAGCVGPPIFWVGMTQYSSVATVRVQELCWMIRRPCSATWD
jgi:hypothetical protein